jgi:hypothetical protein
MDFLIATSEVVGFFGIRCFLPSNKEVSRIPFSVVVGTMANKVVDEEVRFIKRLKD